MISGGWLPPVMLLVKRHHTLMLKRPFIAGCAWGICLGFAALLPLFFLGVQISTGKGFYDAVNAPAFWLASKWRESFTIGAWSFAVMAMIFAQWFSIGFVAAFLLGLKRIRKRHGGEGNVA
jgi:hypothetical protein